MSALFAICEGASGSERALGIVFPPLIIAVWAWLTRALLWRGTDGEERVWLLGLMVVTAITGLLVFQTAEGDTGSGAYRESFLLSLPVAAAIGGAAALLSGRFGLWRGIGIAIAGDVAISGGMVLVFVWALSLSGGCLG